MFQNTYHQASNIAHYEQQLTQIKKNIEILARQLPNKKEEAHLLEAVSQHAAASGLQLIGIKPQPEAYKGFYFELPLQISLIGDFHGFGKFAGYLSSMPRIVTTQDFSIRREKQGTRLKIVLDCKTYWVIKQEI